jgi:hypothetical protein
MKEVTSAKNDLIANETMTIAAGPTANTLKLTGTLTDPGGKTIWSYDFVMTFAADGAFTLGGDKGEAEASGFCIQGLCSYALRPVDDLSTTGTISFKDGLLVRTHNNQDSAGENTSAASNMKKVEAAKP